MNEELKPCPFCERRNTYLSKSDAPYSYFVRCEDCNASGPVVATEEQAIREWNERADPKAAPLVWVFCKNNIWKATAENLCFYIWRLGDGKTFRVKCLPKNAKCRFSTLEDAQAACQTHADGVVKQLVEGNKQ